MQENEAKPHNYQTDIEELKDFEANQIRDELVGRSEDSSKSLKDAISANTSAVVNLTKSIKVNKKKEDNSEDDVLDSLANDSENISRPVEQAYKTTREEKNEFDPFSPSSFFSTWENVSHKKESQRNADILLETYYKHPKTKEEREYRGVVGTILSGIWTSVKGVVGGIKHLSTFVANSIFHPIETAKWVVGKLSPLLAKLAPVATTAIGLGAVAGIATEVFTTRANRERFLKSRGAKQAENGSWDLTGMSDYDKEIASGLVDSSGMLKNADEVGWGTTFKLAFANLADSIKSGFSEFIPGLIDLVTKKVPDWAKTLGDEIASCFSAAIRPVLREFGDSIVDGIAEVTPGMESRAERREKVNSELLESSMKGADYDKSLIPWWFFGKDFETYMLRDSMVARHGSKAGTEQGFSEKFLDTFVNTAFDMSAMERRLPLDLYGYISPTEKNSDGKYLKAIEMFKTTEEFKKWKSDALVADKNDYGRVEITSEEREQLSDLLIKFFEKKKEEKALVYFTEVEKQQAEVEGQKAEQAKARAKDTQSTQPQGNSTTTNNNVVQHTYINYGASQESEVAVSAIS